MEERNTSAYTGNLITDIVLPSLFTILVLFCLVQIGLSVLQSGSDGPEAPSKVTAISAFAS